jgi:hypothetical protein
MCAMTAPEPPAAEPMPWPGYEPGRARSSLLPWSWAVERLERSRRYWLATASAAGTPHLAAVWAAWVDGVLAFSTGAGTRKARDLAARPRCSVATESGEESVVAEGVAEVVEDEERLSVIDAAYAAKYGGSMRMPGSPVFAVRPRRVTAVVDGDPGAAPTMWRL